jgi:hypothetical protein
MGVDDMSAKGKMICQNGMSGEDDAVGLKLKAPIALVL